MMARMTHMYKTVINCTSVEQNVNSILLSGDCGSLYGIINKLCVK